MIQPSQTCTLSPFILHLFSPCKRVFTPTSVVATGGSMQPQSFAPVFCTFAMQHIPKSITIAQKYSL